MGFRSGQKRRKIYELAQGKLTVGKTGESACVGELNRSPLFLPISPDSSPESLSKKTRNYKEEIEKYKLICARNRVINGHATGGET